MKPTAVHVIGAGLSGLSAAVELASVGVRVTVHEASPQAGGRCRTYFDSTLGMDIDNGNHLILSGNGATLSYLDRIGGRDKVSGPGAAVFPFMDLETGRRWTVRANDGPAPWWTLLPSRRVPDTRFADYLALAKLLRARPGATIGQTIRCSGTLYERLLEPFLMSALNIDPPEGSAALAAQVIRETLAAGGRQYHPLIATEGLSAALVTPAVAYVKARGGDIIFGRRLKAFDFERDRVCGLDFGEERIELSVQDAVVLATPPQAATALLPGLSAPTQFRAIVNAHYKIIPPPTLEPIIGIVHGLAQWLFAFPDRLSVTISAGDSLLETPREELANRIWNDVAKVANVEGPMPAWQIVREKRATFAATPAEDAKRPSTTTRWSNLALAGDWTKTGLPATIEGAVRSGGAAARALAG